MLLVHPCSLTLHPIFPPLPLRQQEVEEAWRGGVGTGLC